MKPREAVSTLVAQIEGEDLAGVLFFCSSKYDLDEIAGALRESFACPVVGCTTSGEIASTYQKEGIVAVGFPASHFRLHTALIAGMRHFGLREAASLRDEIQQRLVFSDRVGDGRMFGLVLIDGLSLMEERVIASLHNAFNGMEIVGGSAGDDLAFRSTSVFVDGRFHSNAAVLIAIETTLPFQVFRWQHFEPTSRDLVVTAANPDTRTVSELDGSPAASVYARMLGLREDELNAGVFSRHPVMIQIGQEWYVRSIQRVNPDGSLTFLSAIDNGLPLTVAAGAGFLDVLRKQIDRLRHDIGVPYLTLGCDCVLRRLEMQGEGIQGEVARRLTEINFLGFSTYGEQINGIHVNQTLTGIAIGEGR
jgi:hypothetical protein